ncbi:MAG: ABC transporter ATP-binding protein [Deltaproteobacteria bacterium HGW-Deltaproteobacteria-21]|nr:MAG: ABC transporter ATP-binding protein [Deltaproteobacteria bacterium HGW-Deltaproteobacteria-21]
MDIYLDNAATTFPKPLAVPEAIYDYIVNNGGTSGRGSYEKAILADGLVYQTRKNLAKLKPHQVCRRGIARTFQLVRVFPSMTVLENVLAGAIYGRSADRKNGLNEAIECLEMLNLSGAKDTLAAHLTYSDRRLVEIARAIAAKPGLALLDEPLAALNPAETEKIMAVIQDIRTLRGISIMWIEHKIDAVFHACDRIVVLDYGRKIAEGTPGEIATNKKVVEAYLGEPLA